MAKEILEKEERGKARGSGGGGGYLDFVQPPGSSQAASIFARVGVSNHALLLAIDVLVIPLVAQEAPDGSLAVMQIIQGLEQRRHSHNGLHAVLFLQKFLVSHSHANPNVVKANTTS